MNKQKNALITVIVPIYNAEKYLRRCLDSILNQTYKNLEIILVNDGSTDMSGQICEEYSCVDERIEVFHKENNGVSETRNCGLNNAKGEYIFFVDSDDYLPLESIEKLYLVSREYNADYVGGGIEKVTDKGEKILELIPKKIMTFTGSEALCMHYSEEKENILLMYVTGRLMRRDVFADIRFKKGIYYEDIQLMPYILANCKKIVFLPDLVYYYVYRDESISNNILYEQKRFLDSVEIWEDHIDFYSRQNLKLLIKKVECLILEKIISHDLNGTIPKGLENWSKEKFNEYFIKMMVSSIPYSKKMRFILYRILGKEGYLSIKKYITGK